MKECTEWGWIMDEEHDGDGCECCQDDRSSEEEDESYIYDMEVRNVKCFKFV